MAFPPGDFILVAIGGGLPGGETWQTAQWYQVNGVVTVPSGASMSTLAAQILSDFNTVLWANLKGAETTATTLTSCRLSWYRGGVLQQTGSATQTAVPGISTAPQPVFTARCVTLLTGRAGRRYRGRAYLPYNGVAPTASTGLWVSDATNITKFAQYLNDTTGLIIAAFAATTAGPVVVSQVVGESTPILAVRWDNKPDTQRGREKGITPTVFDSHTVP